MENLQIFGAIHTGAVESMTVGWSDQMGWLVAQVSHVGLRENERGVSDTEGIQYPIKSHPNLSFPWLYCKFIRLRTWTPVLWCSVSFCTCMRLGNLLVGLGILEHLATGYYKWVLNVFDGLYIITWLYRLYRPTYHVLTLRKHRLLMGYCSVMPRHTRLTKHESCPSVIKHGALSTYF